MPSKTVSTTYNPESGMFTLTRADATVSTTAGSEHGSGYLTVKFNGKNVYVHRLAFYLMEGAWPEEQVDHINGDRSDNRWANLRKVSHTVNAQNKRRASRASTSGLLGAYTSGGRFRAQIKVNGSAIHLGRFNSAEEAHAAYLKAKRELHEGCTI